MVVSSVKRTLILHYHFFKNAGTSVDRILVENFGADWESREFSTDSVNNTHLVEQWIRETPNGLKIARRKVLITQSVLMCKNLNTFF